MKISIDDAEKFLNDLDIYHHPIISDRTGKNGYPLDQMLCDFANSFIMKNKIVICREKCGSYFFKHFVNGKEIARGGLLDKKESVYTKIDHYQKFAGNATIEDCSGE